MKTTRQKIRLITYLVLLFCAGLSVGCGASGKTDIPKKAQNAAVSGTADGGTTEAKEQENPELYMITAINSSEETIQLYRYLNGKEYRFYYSVDTAFRDKYQNRSTASEFYPGKIVTIGSADAQGKLSEIVAADSVWKYDDIVRFSIDEENGVFKIADSNYRITSETRVFSDSETVELSSITENDKLSVIGRDKTILSVCITTGHGTLRLENTELFEGSFLQLNTNIFAEITSEMELELPEGEYLLAVANNGWGGNCNIEVVRGEIVEVDLDTIKGEGPKFGSIRFIFDIEDVALTIDGKTIDYSEPVTLQYGKHLLKAGCNGYEQISKYLFVNSEEATIMMNFCEEVEETETEEETKETETTEGTESTETQSDEETPSRDEILQDYLSTLTELIDSL